MTEFQALEAENNTALHYIGMANNKKILSTGEVSISLELLVV